MERRSKSSAFKIGNTSNIGRKIRQARETALQSGNYGSRPRRARKGFGSKVKGFFGL